MDVTMIAYIPEAAPPAQTQKPAGGNVALSGEESGGFAAVFAGLATETFKGGGEQKTADDRPGDMPGTSPGMLAGMMPGMWSFVPLMPPVMNAGQAQPAEGTGAIAPLTAAGPQAITQLDAARGQTLPDAQAALPMTADADLVSQMSGQNGQGGQTAPLPPTADAALTPAPPDKQLAQAANPTADADAAMPAFPVTKVTVAAPPPVTAPARQTVDCLPQQQAPLPAPPQAVATAAKPQQAATTGRQAEETPKGETVATVPAAAATATPVTGASAAGELDVAGDGETALTTADDTAPAPPRQAPAETATATGFAALVEQQANPADRVAADTAQTAQRPAGPDPNNVAGQIVDHARLITRAENNEMVIKLKPEHLGELTLKIAVENGTVRATFHTPNAEVRSAIEASLPQLRHDMANQGLKVDYVGVYASLDHFFANDQRHAPQQQQLNTVRRPSGEEPYTATAAAIAALPNTPTSSGGIDYRV